MNLTISAATSPQYYGHLAEELIKRFGWPRFAPPSAFPEVGGPRDGLFVVLPNGCRVYLSADDHSIINNGALEWCHVYGMVNLLPEHLVIAHSEKFIPLGPLFGVRWIPGRTGLRYVLSAAWSDENRFARGSSRLRAFRRHQRERSPLADYRHGSVDDDFLFFAATFWRQHPEANKLRIEIWRELEADKSWRRQGGFMGATAAEVGESALSPRRYSHSEFLELTRRSTVAVNTNAVHGCLGWKLGEYLALGKAIVSEPLRHVLPSPLDETVIAVADTADGIVEECRRIRADPRLRLTMEEAAQTYFRRFASPCAAIDRVLDRLTAA